jgi:hypothetical protein
LAAKLASRSAAPLALIIRVEQADDAAAAALAARGFEVTRRIQLLPAFAASGPGIAVTALAEQSWVLSIEEDQTVQAM